MFLGFLAKAVFLNVVRRAREGGQNREPRAGEAGCHPSHGAIGECVPASCPVSGLKRAGWGVSLHRGAARIWQ